MAEKFFRRSLESRPGHLPAVIGFAKLLQGQVCYMLYVHNSACTFKHNVMQSFVYVYSTVCVWGGGGGGEGVDAIHVCMSMCIRV